MTKIRKHFFLTVTWHRLVVWKCQWKQDEFLSPQKATSTSEPPGQGVLLWSKWIFEPRGNSFNGLTEASSPGERDGWTNQSNHNSSVWHSFNPYTAEVCVCVSYYDTSVVSRLPGQTDSQPLVIALCFTRLPAVRHIWTHTHANYFNCLHPLFC